MNKSIGSICRFEYGKSLPEKERTVGNVRVYGSNGLIGTHNQSYTQGKTIIIGRKGSIGEINFSNDPCWPIDTTYFIDDSCTDCDLEWLAFALKSLKLGDLNKASGVPGLNRGDAYNQTVLFSNTIGEQRQIAAKLKSQLAEVETARQALDEQLREIVNLANAYICESIESADAVEYNLGEVLDEVKKGIGESWVDYPVLGATRDGLAPAKEPPGKQPQRYKPVFSGTVFYNPMRILIGSIAFVDDDDQPGITSPDYVALQGKPGIVDSRWFYYWLRSPYGVQCINSLARGAVRERMLFNRLAEGTVLLPPYEEQCRISKALAQLKSIKATIQQQLDDLNKIPQRLLAQAFSEA